MDDSHFDHLAKVLTVPSRRGIFTAATTAALASLMAFVARGGSDTARAAKKKKKRSGAKSRPGPAGPQGPQGARGPAGPVQVAYAHVNHTTGSFDPARSKGVNSVQKIDNVYCFNLAFQAKVAVGSTFINNSGVVATWTAPDIASPALPCPENLRDAAAKIYASNDGALRGDVSFKIIFF
jgi:hypothetical protein